MLTVMICDTTDGWDVHADRSMTFTKDDIVTVDADSYVCDTTDGWDVHADRSMTFTKDDIVTVDADSYDL